MPDAKVADLYAEGRGAEQVALLAGISPFTVLRIVKRLGVPVRPRGPRKGPRMKLRISEVEVLALYSRGHTAREIAVSAGCSSSTVYRILADANVPRRSEQLMRRGKPRDE